MTLEVELKAPCAGAQEKAEALGAVFIKSESQKDTYFSHPCRNFKDTDEALRIRHSNEYFITYKGPKKSSNLKAREEIELPVPQDMFTILERLGFKKAFTISKLRKTYALNGLTVCCDLVEGLGEYVEVESSNPKDNDKILNLLDKFGVKDKATVKTYAELLNL